MAVIVKNTAEKQTKIDSTPKRTNQRPETQTYRATNKVKTELEGSKAPRRHSS